MPVTYDVMHVRDRCEWLSQQVRDVLSSADEVHGDDAAVDKALEEVVPKVDVLDAVVDGAFFSELERRDVVAEHLDRQLNRKSGFELRK